MTEFVVMTARCPRCGRDASWHGTRVDDNGTSYRIECSCDWTFTAQRDRLTARRTLLEHEPLPQPGPRQPEPPRRRWRPVVSLLRRTA